MTFQDTRLKTNEAMAAYASGQLDPGFMLLLDTQAALRPELARPLSQINAVAGALFEREDCNAMSDGSLDRMLAAIDGIGAPETAQVRAARLAREGLDEISRLPMPLQDFAFDAIGARGWSGAGRGLRIAHIDTGGRTEVELLRIEPGCGAPRHTHRGHEYTLVVTGSFTDERGQYKPGDISVAGPKDTHQPIADEGDICYALAVRDGGLQFTGWLGLLQRVLGK